MDAGINDAIAAAAQSGLGVVAMKVMAGGARSQKPGDPNYKKLTQEGAMLAALKWVVSKPHISTTIPSITDMDQLDENLKAMANPLSAGEEKILSAHLDLSLIHI